MKRGFWRAEHICRQAPRPEPAGPSAQTSLAGRAVSLSGSSGRSEWNPPRGFSPGGCRAETNAASRGRCRFAPLWTCRDAVPKRVAPHRAGVGAKHVEWAKQLDPTRLVEDMSVCHWEHLDYYLHGETDINSWHFYISDYHKAKAHIDKVVSSTFVGSSFNYCPASFIKDSR